MKALDLKPHEARYLAEHGRVVVMRPMVPQPDHFHRDIIGRPKPWSKEDWARLLPQDGENGIPNPFPPGETRWGREKWAAQHALDGHRPQDMYPPEVRIHYAAAENLGGLMRRPSITLPCWASRFPSLVCVASEPRRVEDVTEDEAREMGFEDLICGPPINDIYGDARDAFLKDYRSRRGPEWAWKTIWEAKGSS